jgi:S1-C subfamily serine protease
MRDPALDSALDSAPDPAHRSAHQSAHHATSAAAQTSATRTTPAARGWRQRLKRYERPLLFAGGAVFALALFLTRDGLGPHRKPVLDQDQIDAAVMRTFETKTLPSQSAKAAESIRESVVRIRSFYDAAPAQAEPKGHRTPPGKPRRIPDPEAPGEDQPHGEGSGVVIVDKGIILTALHVVAGAKRMTITFYNDMETEAELVNAYPDNDLAVLKARNIPDDLPAATLGSTASLQPGDEVVAVGFPFGIGPSVSSGVVSGLNRSFASPDSSKRMTNLIQFDAAANPGNSGGPLITMDGAVVGIVTAILNPTEARTFIGIGFAATIETAGGAVGLPPF